jgi:hypothetical protein
VAGDDVNGVAVKSAVVVMVFYSYAWMGLMEIFTKSDMDLPQSNPVQYPCEGDEGVGKQHFFTSHYHVVLVGRGNDVSDSDGRAHSKCEG